MTNDWIIDVLTDLKKFSAGNKLQRLSDHLDDTIMVATTELASSLRATQTVGEFEQARRYAGPSQPSNRA